MLCVPALKALVLQVAVLLLAVPVGSATAPQPLTVVPSAVKPTLPLGALPVTVAVNVTLAPTSDGLAEGARLVVLAVLLMLLTTCASAMLVELLLAASPA